MTWGYHRLPARLRWWLERRTLWAACAVFFAYGWLVSDYIPEDIATYFWPKPYFLSEDCWFTNHADRPADCGYLVVEEDRSSGWAVVKLPVVIIRSTEDVVHPDPIVLINGGPGITTLGFPEITGRLLAKILPEIDWISGRDLILFEQRGVGLSQPSLHCWEFRDTRLGPHELDWIHELMQRCRDRLRRQGIGLTAYNTTAIARDVEDLRTALGIEQWNLWGASNGSRVALTILRNGTEGVRSAVLAGIFPPNVEDRTETVRGFHRVLEQIFAACAEDPACNSAYPDLAEKFAAIIERLRIRPVEITTRLQRLGMNQPFLVDDAAFIELLFNSLYDTPGVAKFPSLIDDFARRRYVSWNSVIDHWDFWTFGPFDSEGMSESVACNDAGVDGVQTSPDLLRDYPLLKSWIVWLEDWSGCEYWPVSADSALDRTAVRSDVPTLLLAGAYDPATPLLWAERAAETLSNGHLFIFPGHSHDASDDPCAKKLIFGFLEDPEKRPVENCVSDLGPPSFLTP
jgi:pimeloyl-ACP methyl ester carboxylesterase